MGRPLEIPFAYGGAKVVMWFKDDNGVIRGLLIDVSDPNNPQIAKDEVVIRRKTDGQVRPNRKKPMVPPVGQPIQ